MTGALGDHVAEQRFSDQRQIPDQIESFVTAALIDEAKSTRIEHSRAVETDRVH